MRKFLKDIFIFLLPIFAIVLLILFYPVPRNFAYHYQPLDCENRSSWVYERIYEDNRPIDIAFIGSSHVMTEIQDMKLESLLVVKTGKQYNVANLGYCRFGEDLPYVILKDLFKRKHPKLIVLEVLETVGTNSHPVFPFLAEREDLIFPASYLQTSYFSNVYNGWLTRLAAIRFSPDTIDYNSSMDYSSHFGFRYSDHQEEISVLENTKKKKEKPRSKSLLHGFEINYPLAWIDKMQELAKQNGAELCFIYLPAFGSTEKTPELMSLKNKERFLIPPDSILSNYSNWRDPDHMNNNGADELAIWLSDHLFK